MSIAGLVGILGGVALAVAIILAARGMTRRRALRQRLAALAARLGEDPGLLEGRPVEETLSRLERSADHAAEAVTESSADAIRLRKALDALPQGVVVCDDNAQVVFRNARAVALMGDNRADEVVDELLNDSWSEAPPPERTLELYGPPRRTLTLRTQTIDDGQRSLGVIAVVEDVTDRRRLETVRRDFVSNVSHELKMPAGALGLLAETLLSETEPSVTRRLASRMQDEALRVSRIIDDLLDLSRIEAEEAPPREPVLVNLVLAEAIEQVRSMAEGQEVELDLSEPSPPVAIMGDRRQLVSALHNLLENAVKYSDTGSTVEVIGQVEDGHVDMVVCDHGIGIPSRELERIFERFYRVDQRRSLHTGGTGLGLSIVRHVASNHQGSVLVESTEGEGSTFTLRLPLGTASER